MHAFVTPALYCLFVWWFSTGVIVFLNNLPKPTFRWSLGFCTAIALVSLYRLAQGSHDTSVAGAYAAFTYGVLVWGWHEMAFFMGALTGPRKTACPPQVAGWRRFELGVAACIDHELAILGTAVVVLWATWGASNQVGCWTFMALWGMRQSAKLNVFLGVLNLGEAFVPPHLSYLISFMARRRMNFLMPFSLLCGSLLVGFLVHRASAPGMSPFQVAGYGCLITMLALAVLEHALLVLPLPFTALWGFWLRHAGQGQLGEEKASSLFLKKRTKKLLHLTLFERPGRDCGDQSRPIGQEAKVFWFFFSKKNRLSLHPIALQATNVGMAEPPASGHTEARRKPGWANDARFNLSPAKSAV